MVPCFLFTAVDNSAGLIAVVFLREKRKEEAGAWERKTRYHGETILEEGESNRRVEKDGAKGWSSIENENRATLSASVVKS